MKKETKESLGVRINPWVVNALKSYIAIDKGKISKFIEKIIIEELERLGLGEKRLEQEYQECYSTLHSIQTIDKNKFKSKITGIKKELMDEVEKKSILF